MHAGSFLVLYYYFIYYPALSNQQCKNIAFLCISNRELLHILTLSHCRAGL